MDVSLLAATFLAAVGGSVSTSTITAVGVVLFVVLLGVSAFFSSSEIAMFSIAKHRLDALTEIDEKRGKVVQELRSRPHRLLVTILVGNNAANIAMSSIATGLLGIYFSPSQAVLVATFGVTSLVLVLSESAPKSYAVAHSEEWSLRIARPLKISQYLMFPAVSFFDWLTGFINKMTGGISEIETAYVTRSEIKELIETGEEHGALKEQEAEIIRNALDLSRTPVKEVMTPRADVVAAEEGASVREVLDLAVESNHTKIPVYSGELDDIVGMVHVRDLVGHEDEDLSMEEVAKEVLFAPDTKAVGDLLSDMQESRVKMAVVTDEFGTFTGVATMEDLVEEVVGEILSRGEATPIRWRDDGSAVVIGTVPVEEVNSELGLDIPTDEGFETLAGFLMDRFGELPEEGEEIQMNGSRLVLSKIEGTRIKRVTIVPS